jgi:acetylornithine/N-succinyldiaminopimelate aminotransferase
MNLARHQSVLVGNYAPPSLEVVRGKGSKLWDSSGKEYLDFTSGIAVNNLGHCHPTWVKRLQQQADSLVHCSNLFSIPEQVLLAERLVDKIGPGKVLFCNSGAEANEVLLKFSRLFGNQAHPEKKSEILVASNGFHGRTLGALSATESSKYRNGFEPLLPGFRFCKYNDLQDFKKSINHTTAAILIESIQGEGGVHEATDEFLIGIERICQEHRILFLMDEVQAGIGRTGEFLGFQKSGIHPHGIAMAKGLGGGFPIGAVWLAEEYASLFTPGSHGTTYGGSPLACSSALAVLDILESENLIDLARTRGNFFQRGLNELVAQFPQLILESRGRGLMLGLGLSFDPGILVSKLRENGLLTVGAGGNTLRLLPPLNVSESEINEALRILLLCLNEISDHSNHETFS